MSIESQIDELDLSGGGPQSMPTSFTFAEPVPQVISLAVAAETFGSKCKFDAAEVTLNLDTMSSANEIIFCVMNVIVRGSKNKPQNLGSRIVQIQSDMTCLKFANLSVKVCFSCEQTLFCSFCWMVLQ